MTEDRDNNAYQLAASIGYADRLVKQANKEQLAEAMQVMAVAVGYYETKFGEVPQGALTEMLRAERLDDEQMAMITAGMQNLAAALAEVLTHEDSTTRGTVH